MVPTPSFDVVPTFGTAAALVEPDGTTYSVGFFPGQVFPAEFENWFMNKLTKNSNELMTDMTNIVAELTTILTAASLTPDGSSTTQVKASLDALYLGLPAAALLAPKASPTFTGTVTVPTAVASAAAVRKSQLDAEATLARNASNLTSGTVPLARLSEIQTYTAANFLRSTADYNDGNQSGPTYAVPSMALGDYRQHINTSGGVQVVTIPSGSFFIVQLGDQSTCYARTGAQLLSVNNGIAFKIFRVR